MVAVLVMGVEFEKRYVPHAEFRWWGCVVVWCRRHDGDMTSIIQGSGGCHVLGHPSLGLGRPLRAEGSSEACLWGSGGIKIFAEWRIFVLLYSVEK